jgi:hypothetical protein
VTDFKWEGKLNYSGQRVLFTDGFEVQGEEKDTMTF